MGWNKSSPVLQARFRAALPPHPDLEERKMFGYPCAFVRGVFFAGLHQENVVMKASDAVRGALPELASVAGFDPMDRGRAMKDWWVLPGDVAADEQKLASLLSRALDLVMAQPTMVKPAKKATTKRATVKKPAVKG